MCDFGYDPAGMPPEDRERCVELRVKSKSGRQLNEEEMAFLHDRYERFPDDYPKDEEVVDLIRREMTGGE